MERRRSINTNTTKFLIKMKPKGIAVGITPITLTPGKEDMVEIPSKQTDWAKAEEEETAVHVSTVADMATLHVTVRNLLRPKARARVRPALVLLKGIGGMAKEKEWSTAQRERGKVKDQSKDATPVEDLITNQSVHRREEARA